MLLVALGSFLIFAGFTPIAPTGGVLFWLLVANVLGIFLVFCFIVVEAYSLFKARRGRRRRAAAYPDRRAVFDRRRRARVADGLGRIGDPGA
ncbi:hypothetical protein MPC1_7850002 [Methylocella tundrae]|nr:hypothetical protein MPC1_7850002 [Methylocella tundrae]